MEARLRAPPSLCRRTRATRERHTTPRAPRPHEDVRLGAGADRRRLRGAARRGHGARRRQRRGQVDADQVRRRHPRLRRGRDPLRRQAGAASTARRTRRSSGSRSSTRISRSATTSTSSRTCTSAARCTTGSSGSRSRRWSSERRRRCKSLSRHDDPLDPPAGRDALRRPAPVGRGRAAVMWNSTLVILDEPTAALGVAQTEQVLDARQAARRAGARGRADLAQPARHLRGRRPGSPSCAWAATSASTSASKTTQQEVVHAITAGIPTKVAGIAETAGGASSHERRRRRRRAGHRAARGRRPRSPRSLAASARATSSRGNLGVLPVVVGAAPHRRRLQLHGARTSSRRQLHRTSSCRWPGRACSPTASSSCS